MAAYTTDGRFYYISYVTGPSHVRLGLEFATAPVRDVVIEKRPAVGECEHGQIEETKLREAVLDGVASANAELSTDYVVSHIAYIENDSPSYALYTHCTVLLVRRLSAGEAFRPT